MLMYNRNMSKLKSGFTIIEVVIVLAITGLLLTGILAGASTNITRQRYNDSVQNFAEFLRSTYSEVVNVQNPRSGQAANRFCSVSNLNNQISSQGTTKNIGFPGRTECALYGKLIVFGEDDDSGENTTIYSYDIIGRIFTQSDMVFKSSDNSEFTTLRALSAVDADITSVSISKTHGKQFCSLNHAGNNTIYKPQWSARIESTQPTRDLYKGMIMIVRSPISGTIHTYSLDLANKNYNIHSALDGKNSHYQNIRCNDNKPFPKYDQLVKEGLSLSSYLPRKTPTTDGSGLFSYENRPEGFQEITHKTPPTNFCVASPDIIVFNNQRRNVRLAPDGRNSTAVKLIEFDAKVANQDGEDTSSACQ